MPNYRVQVELPWTTGLPEDVTVGVWHCIAPDVAGAEDFAANVVGLYQTIDAWLSNLVSEDAFACSWTVYDLADPKPRAPKASGTFTMDVATTTTNPEIALCLSFQAAQVSGSPQARRRGRIFFGPFSAAAIGSDGRPAAALVTALSDAGNVLLDASGTWDWAVFSPSDNTARIVADGWVDNEFDVQRRRGRRATSRTTFT